MFTLTTISIVLVAHFVCDFIFQTREIAENKSKDLVFLFVHGLGYGSQMVAVIAIVGLIFTHVSFLILLTAGAFNMLAHTAVDFVTSKITSKAYKEEKFHKFFSIIGIDQATHVVTLLVLLSCM